MNEDRDIVAELDAKIAAMPAEKQAELEDGLAEELAAKWRPDPRNKPQVEAFYSPAQIMLFGGAAGGGKTDLIIGLALESHEKSVIFRRQSMDLRDIENRLLHLNRSRAGWNGQKSYLKQGEQVIELGHLGRPGDEQDWQGRPHDLIAFDEGAQIEEHKVRFVIGWLRSARKQDGSVVRRRVIIGSNPPVGGEGEWLIDWFAPWLNPLHPKYGTVKPGELLWAIISEQGETIWVEGPGWYQVEGEPRPIMAMSRTFIPSFLKNNPYLAGTGYEAQIMQLQEPWRTAMLTGNFMTGRRDHAQQIIPGAWVDAANERWKRGKPKVSMTAIACDVAQGGLANTSIARLWGTWFDEMIREPGRNTPNGPSIAALIIQHRRGMAEVTLDLTGGWGISARDHLQAMDIDVAPCVFSAKSGKTTKDHKFKFGNLRAQMYWQFREGLDPESKEDIALPPDPKVKAQLCTPRFEIKGNELYVEDKEDIEKRLGTTVDEADAIVMAWWRRGFYGIAQAMRKGDRNKMGTTAEPADPLNWED
jgi:hypothetical protein